MKNKALYILSGTLVAIVATVLFTFGYVNGLRNEGISQETALSAQYESNQNYLSMYTISFYEQLGIADRKSAKLDTILQNAVSGRYGDDGFKGNGQMFSAISEAYPDLTQNLEIFDRVLTHVAGGREAFRGRQDQLLDRARAYKTWKEQGIIRHMVIGGLLGFPSNVLEARVGGRVVATGDAALVQMQNLVLTGSAVEAFETGRQDALPLPR